MIKFNFNTRSKIAGLLIILFCCVSIPAGQDKILKEAYLKPPGQVVDILQRSRHYDVLNALSPDGEHFMIPIETPFSTLQQMSIKTYRLGMLEFCPEVNRDWRLSTYGIQGIKIFSLKTRKSKLIKLAENIYLSDMVWSPSGKKIYFLTHLKKGTRVWVADVKTGKAKVLNKQFVMTTLTGRRGWRVLKTDPSKMLQVTPNGSVITLFVPAGRGSEPRKGKIPFTPLIRSTRKKAAPTSTYPFLLRTPHDKKLFEYYTTSQPVLISPGGRARKIGKPAMYLSISLSPGGRYILAQKIVKPFSYIVSYRGFARELVVMDLKGRIISVIRKTPLIEGNDRNGNGVKGDLAREVNWLPAEDSLCLLIKGKKVNDLSYKGKKKKREDFLKVLSPPFDIKKARTLVSVKGGLSKSLFSPTQDYLFFYQQEDKQKDLAIINLKEKKQKKQILLKCIDEDDLLKDPGKLIVKKSVNGLGSVLISGDNKWAYLQGGGYNKIYKPRPFINRINLETARLEQVFKGSLKMYEKPLVIMDRDVNRMIVSRQSLTVFPDSYLWKKGGELIKLTSNRNPFPEFARSKKIFFNFTRRDGLKIFGKLSLPADYKKGERLPAVFWTYPREFKSIKKYKMSIIRSKNINAFPQLSYRRASAIWHLFGYAVVVPDIPIIGRGNNFNNNYVANLVDSMYAAIRKVDQSGYIDIDRLGHGGHSYGAFATANILARSPFFKAGIAGDGAYNRTLTPMGFQRERRFIWEAPQLYLEMSPFFQADHLDTPILMYHGAEDNNSGTFLIQSERFLQALTGLGKTAALYIYPFESHGPRSIETYMDMWARWLLWFDKYVKNPLPIDMKANKK